MNTIERLIAKHCPNGTEFRELGDVCKTLSKGTLKTNELVETGQYPVINSGRGFYGKYNKYNNEKNAITIAARGEYAGFINFIGEKFWAGGLCYPYASKGERNTLTKFIFYSLKAKQSFIREMLVARGSIPALNKGDIDKLKIPIPPLPVQEEIVRILDNFTELEAELEARKNQYQYYRDHLLTFGDEVEWKELGEVAEAYDGTHQTPKYTTEGVPFVSVENIKNLYGTKKFILPADFNKYKYKPQKNDLFMTRIGDIGTCAVVKNDDSLAYYVTLTLIRPDHEQILTKYLKFIIESNVGKRELYKKTLVNATPIKINLGDISKIKIPIPPLTEQERIVAILDNFDALTNDLSIGLPAEIAARRQQYEYYRDKLLTFREV